MKLLDTVVRDAILPDLTATDRDAAITELVDALVGAGAIDAGHRDEYIKSIIARETRGSTGFGHGVAVPHVKHDSVERMMIAVGISNDGVDFNALDREPVYTIFLLLSPDARPEDHLDAMEAIFGNLSQDTFRSFLRQAKSVENVLTLLEEADARAGAH